MDGPDSIDSFPNEALKLKTRFASLDQPDHDNFIGDHYDDILGIDVEAAGPSASPAMPASSQMKSKARRTRSASKGSVRE